MQWIEWTRCPQCGQIAEVVDRDYKATDFAMAELSWLWGVNRHILTPPGLDEQWLLSLVTTDADMATLVDDFRELAQALRA